jgi:hypothetical protein
LLYHHSEDGHRWPTLLLYIDNQEVVDRGSKKNPNFLNIRQYLTHDFDLWMVLSHLQKHMALRVEFEWIKGHQTPTDDMDKNVGILLNIDVDNLATAQYAKHTISPQRGVFLAGTVCFHQRGHHVQNIYNAISSRETDQDLLDHYVAKGWTLEALEKVEWVALGTFLKRRHPIERCKAIQTMHNWQNTGYQKQLFSNYDHGHTGDSNSACNYLPSETQIECPLRCGHVEIPFHYMQCTSTILSDARILGIEKLEKSLYKMHTSPPLLEAILQGILCWETATEYDLTAESHPSLFDLPHSQLLEHQSMIGWEQFLKGYIAKDWGVLQGRYYRDQQLTHNRKFTKNSWIQNLLLQLHYYRHRIWMVRNETLHGGITKDQKALTRKHMLQEVKALYRKNRRRIPFQERSLFQLPLRFRLKQGRQQLQLWIKRTQLMFARYEEIPISKDQTNRITDWLSQWNLDDGVTSQNDTRATTSATRARAYSIDSETSAPRPSAKQSDISNWLKSWGHNLPASESEKIHQNLTSSVSSQETMITEYSKLK